MPIFQDDLDHPVAAADAAGAEPQHLISTQQQQQHQHQQNMTPSLTRKLSEESIRTELCEGPILENSRPSTPETDAAAATSDRAELIERLKRGESPTWIPNRRLESLLNNLNRPTTPRSSRPPSNSSNLLPPANITPEKVDGVKEEDERLREGLSIQRPRSALHSGDFTEDQPQAVQQPVQESRNDQGANEFLTSRTSWIATSPPRDFSSFHFDRRIPFSASNDEFRSVPSSLSSSFSSSFIYKPPTSPLVQSESNDDVDLSLPLNSIDIAASPLNLNSRRHTLNSTISSPFAYPSPSPSALHRRASQRGSTVAPYQAHQPRRSLTSAPHVPLPGTSPQTPGFLRPRRPSFNNSDTSPLQHASMVGSYEESIIRGRMSTTPSKPLDFVAQIGVLGLGKCKPSLRCPAHVTLPFPAVFYSYGGASQGRVRSEDGPSPYVGQIDLENGLTNSEEGQRAKRKMQSRYAERKVAEDDVIMGDGPALVDCSDDVEARKAQRSKRKSVSPRAPPGGSYRIPEKGQIQIVIKNPNKTAVKLFLVPYDLAGMEPGTKTFIRQRSYSAGPIIENAPGLEDAVGLDKPILRYLVHLHICCPAKGRYYLYKSIRIVFANRVPDGKEKLRNETTCPEPRYTPYKPIRVMHPPLSNSGPAATLAAEKAFRRRSSGFPFVSSLYALDTTDVLSQSPQKAPGESSSSPFNFADSNRPVEPIPFPLSGRGRLGSDFSDSTATTTTTTADIRSPQASQATRPTTKDACNAHVARYEKLNKGDVGYGGNAFALPGRGSLGGTEGLLSQRLRSLGVQNQGEVSTERRDSQE
ncbi:uncharacterized protein CTRU02_212067 [Colletotrichum truncatum]|uniref:Uncharacterized protein n=1 Tax=Colletotrichum truncatum TaxID=5467 RepID=A0ACC3YMI3_COLTU|nr:uncharacterized protein CTRU02_06862 [Colletotrichum truncatum]KAF6792245.1 hypothetical protein CTRU02_06862 [Colletotrichum truncatum]